MAVNNNNSALVVKHERALQRSEDVEKQWP